MDTYADDLAALVTALDLRDAVHVGHSTGGGEVARYVGRHGTGRVAKIVLISAVVPGLLQSDANPKGMPRSAFDPLRSAMLADRAQFFHDFAQPFFGANRPGAKVSQGTLDAFWRQSMMCSLPAGYDCIAAFSETDFRGDLKRFDVPTLILHGEDDQVVPLDITGRVTARLVKGATLKTFPGLPHGLCTTHKDVIDAELLGFLGQPTAGQPVTA
jgi:non-heme chloroperoxidase